MKRFASDIVPTHIAGMGATVTRGFSQEATIYVRFFSHPVIKKIGPLRLSNESTRCTHNPCIHRVVILSDEILLYIIVACAHFKCVCISCVSSVSIIVFIHLTLYVYFCV